MSDFVITADLAPDFVVLVVAVIGYGVLTIHDAFGIARDLRERWWSGW